MNPGIASFILELYSITVSCIIQAKDRGFGDHEFSRIVTEARNCGSAVKGFGAHTEEKEANWSEEMSCCPAVCLLGQSWRHTSRSANLIAGPLSPSNVFHFSNESPRGLWAHL